MTLDRRAFLRWAGAATLAPLATGCPARATPSRGPTGSLEAGAEPDSTSDPGIERTYDDFIVIDALASPIQFNIPQQALPLDEVALAHVRASGITAVNLTANRWGHDAESSYQATSAYLDAWTREIRTHPDVFRRITTAADIQAAKEADQLGIILGFQDGMPFEHDLTLLDEFHARGVRIVQLTYNRANALGVGCLDQDTGLTALGRDAVARMDELGVLVDLSHCGPRTTRDAIEAARGPVSITHSGCDAVYDHPRGKDDQTLRLLAERGGVVGIYLMPFLNPSGAPTTDDVLRHIEHALRVCGADHVGIGSDQGIAPLDVGGDFPALFAAVAADRAAAGIAAPREDTIPYVPELNHPRRLETIAHAMARRGQSTAVIEKVMGGNFLRLFSEIWTARGRAHLGFPASSTGGDGDRMTT